MINSLTNHMELFDFTSRNKSLTLQTWKEGGTRRIEGLTAPFTLDQPLNTLLQLLTPHLQQRTLKLHLFHHEHVYALTRM